MHTTSKIFSLALVTVILLTTACAKVSSKQPAVDQTGKNAIPTTTVGRLVAALKDPASTVFNNSATHATTLKALLANPKLKALFDQNVLALQETHPIVPSKVAAVQPGNFRAAVAGASPGLTAACLAAGAAAGGVDVQCKAQAGGGCIEASAWASAKFCAEASAVGFGFAEASAQCSDGTTIHVEAYAYAEAHVWACAEAVAEAYAYACVGGGNAPAANAGAAPVACPTATDGPFGEELTKPITTPTMTSAQ